MSNPSVDNEGASNVQPVDQLLPELEGWGKLSYRVSDAPPPVNYHDWYVRAVLIELRLIRRALEAGNNPPVETKAQAKK